MTPKQFLEKQDDGYIAGDYTPNEVYLLMEDYAKFKMWVASITVNKKLEYLDLFVDEKEAYNAYLKVRGSLTPKTK